MPWCRIIIGNHMNLRAIVAIMNVTCVGKTHLLDHCQYSFPTENHDENSVQLVNHAA